MNAVRFRLLVVFLCLAASGAPQIDRASVPVIRVSVDLVQIDAMVTDSKGRHVSDLRSEDFEVLEDGKPQKLSHLLYVDTRPKAPTPTKSGRVNAGLDSIGVDSVSVRATARQDVHRVIVFMLDDLHTSPGDIAQLRPTMKTFIDEQLAPGDLVSVMATRGSMGIYEQFTGDKRQITAAMDWLLRRVGQDASQINTGSDSNAPHKLSPSGSISPALAAPLPISFNDTAAMQVYHDASMGALERAINGLHDMPGRKSIVFFSDGAQIPYSGRDGTGWNMVQRVEQIADLANRSGVVFYTFDAKGLVTNAHLASMPGSPGNNEYLTAQRGNVESSGISFELAKVPDLSRQNDLPCPATNVFRQLAAT